MTVTVAVDCGGADLGPAEVAAGAAIAAGKGVRVRLFGDAAQIGPVADGVEVVDAPLSIAKHEDPARAARSMPEASVVQAARAVAAGEADAFVSGGSTGAALAAGLFEIKRARGIYRPALATPVPIPGAPITLLDVGANSEVRSEHLVQFAFMGAALATTVLGVERPRVGLLSNGEEAGKGTQVVIEAHAALRERAAGSPALEFVGNVEGTDVASGVGRRDRHRRLHRQRDAQGDGGDLAGDPRGGPRARDVLAARQGRRRAAAARAARIPRRDRPRGARRGLSARAAPARRRAARALHALRHLAGDPAGRARGRPATSSGAPIRRSSRPAL